MNILSHILVARLSSWAAFASRLRRIQSGNGGSVLLIYPQKRPWERALRSRVRHVHIYDIEFYLFSRTKNPLPPSAAMKMIVFSSRRVYCLDYLYLLARLLDVDAFTHTVIST
ncbi:uncharacterized protein EI90DRAFT_1620441 [Cantharellus anzutake]|uniref:uncharacterized protein n=1 Tax=Cantharellus anzutake TaxID=1750568 RepID=UPI0019033ECA|nr:uncharacterized protein EI90DRAFT_1620441 [Cantharellus anzutake]KAF8328260.1 hypothetical protein EI90DRAFT_1620441 [Cantharellus anzutake]